MLLKNERMTEWKMKWMDEWEENERVSDERMNEWRMIEWMEEWMNIWMNGGMRREWMNDRMKWMNMNESTNVKRPAG